MEGKKLSRLNKYTSKEFDGRTCDCTWMDHRTRRVGGVNAALSEREKDGALRAPSFYTESRRSLSLYELDCFPPSGSFLLPVVALLSSIATFACSRGSPVGRGETRRNTGYATFVHVMLDFDVTSFPSDTTNIWHFPNRRTPPKDTFLLHRAPSG